jgi:hypothetical protein
MATESPPHSDDLQCIARPKAALNIYMILVIALVLQDVIHLHHQNTEVKGIVSIILLFSFLTINFSKSILIAHYEMNKAEITQKYCVNKDKPQLHCCGKCLLKKKLAEQEEQQKSPAVPDIKNDIQLFGSPVSMHINNDQNVVLNIASPYLHILQPGVHVSVFHPPCA